MRKEVEPPLGPEVEPRSHPPVTFRRRYRKVQENFDASERTQYFAGPALAPTTTKAIDPCPGYTWVVAHGVRMLPRTKLRVYNNKEVNPVVIRG